MKKHFDFEELIYLLFTTSCAKYKSLAKQLKYKSKNKFYYNFLIISNLINILVILDKIKISSAQTRTTLILYGSRYFWKPLRADWQHHKEYTNLFFQQRFLYFC